MTEERFGRFGLPAISSGLGLGIAVLDRGQSEVQPAALLLLVCGFTLGALRPRDAWAQAFLLGSGVPILDLVGRAAGISPPWPSQPGSSLLAFVPAFVGAGLGALARWISSQVRAHQPRC